MKTVVIIYTIVDEGVIVEKNKAIDIMFWIMLDIVLIVSIITGAIMSIIAFKNFGMTNGDVLGATNELSRAITIILMLALIPVI